MDIRTDKIVGELTSLIQDLKFPLQNLNVINNGHCRMCQFNQKIVSAMDIKKLQQHYKKHHKVKDIQNSDPQLRKIVQENNSLDPNTTCKTIGIFESTCIQLQCRQIRIEKRKSELGTLTEPCLKILQDGKNKKFMDEQHLLEKDDFIKHPVFACDAHSCKHHPKSRHKRDIERLTINQLTLQYGVMYSFDLFLFTQTKLKLSNFHPGFKAEMRKRRKCLNAATKKLTPMQRQAAVLRNVTEFLISQNYNLETMTKSADIQITWRTGDIDKTYNSLTKKITTMESKHTAICYPPNKKMKL